jgi:hypothetical protein
MAGLFASANFDRLLARRIFFVVDPLSRTAVMLTPLASAPCSDAHELEER